jgi:signal transduction histidine kinase
VKGVLISSEEHILGMLQAILGRDGWELLRAPDLGTARKIISPAWCRCLFVHSAELEARAIQVIGGARAAGFRNIMAFAGSVDRDWEEKAYECGALLVARLPVNAPMLRVQLSRLTENPKAAVPAAGVDEFRQHPPDRSAELGSIREFARLLRYSGDADSFVAASIEQLRDVLGVNRAALYLGKEDQGTLKCAYATGLDAAVVRHVPLSTQGGLGGYVWQRGLVAVLGRTADLDDDCREEMTTLGVQLAIPVRTRDERIGVLVLGPRLLGEALSREAIEVVFVLMEGLALILGNARLDAELKREQWVFASVLDFLRVAYAVFDSNLRVEHKNDLMGKCLGIPRGQELDFSALPARLREMVYAVLEGRSTGQEYEHRIEKSRSAGYLITVQALPPASHPSRRVLVVAHEYTDIWASRAAAVNRNRSALLEQLGAQASHLFNNVLSPLATLQQSLRTFKGRPEAVVEHLEKILPGTVTRMQRYVEELEGIGGSDINQEETLEVRELVREGWARASRLAGALDAREGEGSGRKLPALKVDADTMMLVRGSQHTLTQALAELMLNAIEAAPDAASVLVTFDETPNGHAAISIHDDGPGIGEDDLNAIGEPFKTRKIYSLGLGYNIVRKAIEKSGGSVEYSRSKHRRGTACTMKLPVPGVGPAG